MQAAKVSLLPPKKTKKKEIPAKAAGKKANGQQKRGRQGEGGGRKAGGNVVESPNSGKTRYRNPDDCTPSAQSSKKAKVETVDEKGMAEQCKIQNEVVVALKEEIDSLRKQQAAGERKLGLLKSKTVAHITNLKTNIDAYKALVGNLASTISMNSQQAYAANTPADVVEPAWLVTITQEEAAREEIEMF